MTWKDLDGLGPHCDGLAFGIENPDKIRSLGFDDRAEPPSRKSIFDSILNEGFSGCNGRNLKRLHGAEVRPHFNDQLPARKPMSFFGFQS